MTKEIIYIGDPMCSWCWGFAPVINLIQNDFNDKVPLSIILGGLHAYDNFPMTSKYKSNIRRHWEDVNKATGAVFDYSFFERRDFILDTEPACRAVVAIRQLNPSLTLTFYESISRSFYSENKDTTTVNTFKPLVENLNVDFRKFAAKFNSTDIKEDTRSDFAFSKKIGVTGFPTVLVKQDDKLALLTAGYQPYQDLKPVIVDWLKNGLS
jgi:putative protein-disulfide isomerase